MPIEMSLTVILERNGTLFRKEVRDLKLIKGKTIKTLLLSGKEPKALLETIKSDDMFPRDRDYRQLVEQMQGTVKCLKIDSFNSSKRHLLYVVESLVKKNEIDAIKICSLDQDDPDLNDALVELIQKNHIEEVRLENCRHKQLANLMGAILSADSVQRLHWTTDGHQPYHLVQLCLKSTKDVQIVLPDQLSVIDMKRELAKNGVLFRMLGWAFSN